MFTTDFIIDSIQMSKKTVADHIFTDKVLNKAAHSYIDAQTAFAKMLSRNTMDMVKYSVDSLSKVVFPQKEQASRAPYKVEKEAK